MFRLTAGLLLMVFALLGVAPNVAQAQTTYTLRLATWGSMTHPQVVGFVPVFTKLVEERSQGRIKIQYFPGAGLVKEQDVMSAIPADVADISLTSLDEWSAVAPELGVFGSPLMSFDFDQFVNAIHPGTKIFEATNTVFSGHGARLLAAIDVGPSVFVSKMPLEKPGDYKGKTIRVYSHATGDLVQALGAAPTQLNQNDLYAALSTGTVQAAYGGLSGVYGAKLYEVTKYLAYPAGMFGLAINGYVMNAAKFNSLPKDLQRIVLDAAAEADTNANRTMRDAYQGQLKAMASNGMTVTTLSPKDPGFASVATSLKNAALDKYRSPLTTMIHGSAP
jgi:TRAP-type C4-dicarboxylate transport system substrate-binding protein